MVYGFLKKHDDYDRVMDFDRSYFGHHDNYEMKEPLIQLRKLAKQILNAGLFLSMMGIKLNKKLMLTILCVGNVILMLPSLWMPFRRYGPDYTAYINQAG